MSSPNLVTRGAVCGNETTRSIPTKIREIVRLLPTQNKRDCKTDSYTDKRDCKTDSYTDKRDCKTDSSTDKRDGIRRDKSKQLWFLYIYKAHVL